VPRPSKPGLIAPFEVRAAVATYRPNGTAHDRWDDLGPFVRDAVINGGCTSLSGVFVALKAVSEFAAWAVSQGLPLDKEAILDEATVERFVAIGMPHLGSNSRATYASTLRRIGPLCTRRAYWSPKPQKVSHKVLAPPYAKDDVEWMWHIAASQKTPGRRRSATALLALALGAGLKAHELAAVRSEDVDFRTDAVLVTVPGARARRVPVLPPAHGALRWLCEKYEGRQLYADITASRTAPSQVSREIEVPPRAPSFDSPRLRTTWLVNMLTTGLSLSGVYLYAGTVSTQSLRDLLPYVPARDEAAIFADIARWSR
jgi:integrase